MIARNDREDYRVHFVSMATHRVTTDGLGEGIDLNSFGHLYVYPDFVLIASGRHLARFNQQAQRVWQTKPLAVDGVIADRVEGNMIYGQGELVPPGVWRPVVVTLESGAVVR